MRREHIQPNLTADGERLQFALVYQAGIANVFRVDSFNLSDFGRDASRVYQGDFRTCEAIAYGCGVSGAVVMAFACNQAGDIAKAKWTDDLESQPFSDKFLPVFFTIGIPEVFPEIQPITTKLAEVK